MKIVVDWDLCQGHGVCQGDAPEVFRVEENGTLTVLQENPPESLRKQVEAAREFCPTGAISIVD